MIVAFPGFLADKEILDLILGQKFLSSPGYDKNREFSGDLNTPSVLAVIDVSYAIV